jgi:hypothetical protein
VQRREVVEHDGGDQFVGAEPQLQPASVARLQRPAEHRGGRHGERNEDASCVINAWDPSTSMG